MGLVIGCLTSGDITFSKKYDVEITSYEMGQQINLRWNSSVITLSRMLGDCTAASLNTQYCHWQTLIKKLPVVLEYLSLNGRISCFFSRKVDKADIEVCLAQLKQFPFMGLHIQKSNRDPEKNTYMITGILKVPNAFINNYNKWDGKDYPHHNHLDVSKFNELNQQYHLPTL